MTRIAYFVHGRGKGHAVRTLAVMEALREGYHVRLFCAGEAWELLEDLPGAERVPACVPGKGMITSFALRFRGDRQSLRRWSPDLVVSDGDGPSVNAARSLGIPVVAIGHGLVFRHARLNSGLPLHKRVREVINAGSSSWPASRRVIVHFAPVEVRTRGTYVARPDLPGELTSGSTREDYILAYFRDDNGAADLEELTLRGHRVVLFGRPQSVPPGVEVHPPSVEGFADALRRCKAVVGSGGNHLPAECAMLGIPMLTLYREGDREQEMNAYLVEAAGIGIAARLGGCSPDVIERFEAEFGKPRDDLAVRTRVMRPASEVIIQAIEDALPRASS